MRTPNVKCIICGKPLYRRPFELKNVNFVCCIGCRSEAYKLYPNKNGLKNLELGREKGNNHLTGIKQSDSEKQKRSKTMKKLHKENPNIAKDRGVKQRGENHYNWNGGITYLNQDVRSLDEMRKWQKAIKYRDKQCQKCGSKKQLEAHHIISVKDMLIDYNINSRDEARKCNEFWSLDNGITYCRKCHYELEGRTYDKNR